MLYFWFARRRAKCSQPSIFCISSKKVKDANQTGYDMLAGLGLNHPLSFVGGAHRQNWYKQFHWCYALRVVVAGCADKVNRIFRLVGYLRIRSSLSAQKERTFCQRNFIHELLTLYDDSADYFSFYHKNMNYVRIDGKYNTFVLYTERILCFFVSYTKHLRLYYRLFYTVRM